MGGKAGQGVGLSSIELYELRFFSSRNLFALTDFAGESSPAFNVLAVGTFTDERRLDFLRLTSYVSGRSEPLKATLQT